MSISKHGYGAIAMITIGTLYNAVAMILPMWTVSSTVNTALTNEVASTNFKAGLMSFCIDSELTNSTTTLDHCFYYKFGSGYKDLNVINEMVWTKYSDYATCEGYSKAGDVSDAERLAYSTVIATAAGMDGEQFDKFLDKSCGILGMGTMTFGGMSMSNGLMAIIAIVGAITCRKGDKKWVGGGFFLAGVAAFTAMLTFVQWLVQAGPLGEKDDTSLKTAFFLMIIAMLRRSCLKRPIAKVVRVRTFSRYTQIKRIHGRATRIELRKIPDEKRDVKKNEMEHDAFFVF